ncbi:hypothetical protein V2G26_008545 [Clonostachys chloroleuca]
MSHRHAMFLLSGCKVFRWYRKLSADLRSYRESQLKSPKALPKLGASTGIPVWFNDQSHFPHVPCILSFVSGYFHCVALSMDKERKVWVFPDSTIPGLGCCMS